MADLLIAAAAATNLHPCGSGFPRGIWRTSRMRRKLQTQARTGRPSVPPEKLLLALLLQILYTVRSEQLLMEQLDYNLLFRWFVGLNMGDPAWDPPRQSPPLAKPPRLDGSQLGYGNAIASDDDGLPRLGLAEDR